MAGAVSGCAWFDTDPPPPPPPDPLEPLLAATRALAARYAAALASHPELSDQLAPLHEAHLAHATALVELIGRPELASPTAGPGGWSPPLGGSPAGPGNGSPSPGGPDEPPEDLLAGLREAELTAREEATAACLAAPPERAAVLGSITAARATHAEVLR
ncbi:MAG: hypothetical protein GEV12_04180 [Micromonosporaceae bacterium]|nr:hypothetical protein [Micromonosporaceae bacterium]